VKIYSELLAKAHAYIEHCHSDQRVWCMQRQLHYEHPGLRHLDTDDARFVAALILAALEYRDPWREAVLLEADQCEQDGHTGIAADLRRLVERLDPRPTEAVDAGR
jgi:hypothetical protein